MKAFLIETSRYNGIIIDGDIKEAFTFIDRIKPVEIDYDGNVILKDNTLKFAIVDVQEKKEGVKEDA